MAGSIHEIKIMDIAKLPEKARKQVFSKLDDKQKFKRYVKIVYETASPLRITEVSPVEGSILDAFREIEKRGGVCKVF